MSTLFSNPDYIDFCARYRNNLMDYVDHHCRQRMSWQQEDFIRLAQEHGAQVAVASGHGCFGLGTEIMLHSGEIKPVESVNVGDILMGDDGTPRNVLALKRGREALYRFTYNDGSSHVFNESHILCLVATNSKGRRESGEKTEVTVRDWLQWGADRKRCHAVYRASVNDFGWEPEELPIPAYILGLWLGDGHIHTPTITTPDREVSEAWGRYAVSKGYRLTYWGASGKARMWHIGIGKGRANPFIETLRAHGLTDELHIPKKYLLAPYQDRLELLAGIIDTDGFLASAGTAFDVVQKSERFARDIVWLAKSIGCHATVNKTRKKCCNTGAVGDYWRINIGRNIDKIPVRVERRKPIDRNKNRPNLNFGIRSCAPLGEGDYYGFILDGNSKFLGGDFTVLHNTGKTFLLAWLFDWHLRVYPLSNALLTANSIDQCRTGVWKYMDEVIADVEAINPYQRGHFVKETKRYFNKHWKDSWYVIPRTASKSKPESLAGQHNENYLCVVDEASGVDDVIHGVLRGALTQAGNRYIMVSQPTRANGHFADAWGQNSSLYKTLNLNSEESPLVTREFIEMKLIEYGGHHSPEYQIKVLGRLPDNMSGFLIPKSWLEDAQTNQIEHKEAWGWILTADVAEGKFRDSSVWSIAKVSGYGPDRKVDIVETVEYLDKDELAFAREIYQRVQDFPNITVAIDGDGPGRTVILTLEELGVPCETIHWGLPPFSETDKRRYKNLRAYASYQAREALRQQRIHIPRNKKIVEQGSKIPYKMDEKGRYSILPKDQMASQGIKSPDLFDTVCFFYLVDYTPVEEASDRERNEALERAKKILAGND